MRSFLTKCLTLFVPLILLFSIPSESLAQKRWPVEIVHTGTDTIGQRVAYQIKEIIQNSATMGPYTGSESAWFKIRLASMATDSDQQNDLTCYSTVLTMCITDSETKVIREEAYLKSWVGVCGALRVRETAEGIIAGVSKQFDRFRAAGK
jgi:hypothetical protein